MMTRSKIKMEQISVETLCDILAESTINHTINNRRVVGAFNYPPNYRQMPDGSSR